MSESDSDTQLPTVDPTCVPSGTPMPTVVGIVLVGGTSQRFGDTNKLLAEIDGEPIVRHATRGVCNTAVTATIAVLGHDRKQVETALSGLPIETVVNAAYRDGQSTSVQTGVRAAYELVPDADAVVIALGDMPFVSVETINTLIQVYATGEWDALAPSTDDVRGNPVLFGRDHAPALTNVTGDVGGREILLAGDRSALVAVSDPGIHRDVDRPSDL